MTIRIVLFCSTVLLIGIFAPRSANAQTGWSPVIVARGPLREQIESTPIELRPNRPFHFYGNAVRREYYRGQPAPIYPVRNSNAPTPFFGGGIVPRY